MAEVIFARTRHTYDSYTDFWRLVEVSGYPTCHADEIDPQSDHTYIITPVNGEWQEGWQQPRARIILWDMEWRDERPEIPGVAEIWASDKWYAERINARYVLLGSDTRLLPTTPVVRELRYDLAVMAYLGPWRRNHLTTNMIRAGLTFAPNAWGEQRHQNLVSSLAMLHIHQHDQFPTIAPLRWALAAAYGLPLISESVADRGAFTGRHFLSSEYANLVPFTCRALQEFHALQEAGASLKHYLCTEHPFRREVEAAL